MGLSRLNNFMIPFTFQEAMDLFRNLIGVEIFLGIDVYVGGWEGRSIGLMFVGS